jgi:HSP20 family protein
MTKTKKKDVDAVVEATESTKVEPAKVEPTKWEVQDWFDRWADQFGMHLPEFLGNRLPEFWGASREMGGVIRIEETVDDDGVTIRGELPGIDPEKDLEIVVEDGRLKISAERRQYLRDGEEVEGPDDAPSARHSEFRYGSYRRTCTLPAGVDADDIEATYDKGILEIKIPVEKRESTPKRIAVTS